MSNFFKSMLSNELPNINFDIDAILASLSNLSNLGGGGVIISGGDFIEPCDAFHDTDSVQIDHSLIINSNLHVGGEVCFNRMRAKTLTVGNIQLSNVAMSNMGVTGSLMFQLSNPESNVNGDAALDGWWKQYIEYSTNSVDLIFRSKRGTIITFQDEFYPEVLNFTGKHRCDSKSRQSLESSVGMIVIAIGQYKNLQGISEIGIDEAIPIIDLCKKEKDKRVFGVIGGTEKEGKFRIGNMSFKGEDTMSGTRTIVQNTGEGGVWVCSWNGPLTNGDYITTSPIKGLGMKQDEDYNANFTVGKITCDCDFDLNSHVYKCEAFTYRNKTYYKAFVGCVYCC